MSSARSVESGAHGGITARRMAFAQEMLAHPEWKSRDIYRLALARGLWPDDGDFDDEPERNKKRVQGLRHLCKRLPARNG